MSETQKAILITEENRNYLEHRWLYDEDELEECIGMYIVAEFGEPVPMAVLSKEMLEGNFDKTGKVLNNDYFEVRLNGR